MTVYRRFGPPRPPAMPPPPTPPSSPPPAVSKSLPQLAVPLVISFTTRFLFTLVDMWFAKQVGEGNSGVAAIAFFAPFQAFYIALWVGLSGGFTASLSTAFGHRDEGRVRDLKRGMLRILTGMVPILIAIGALHGWMIPGLYGGHLEPALLESFQIYCTTLLCGMALTGFWAMYPDSVVKAHQDTRSTMIAGLIASFSNIGLNAVFVFVFHLGIFGIALATVLSRLTSLAYAIYRTRILERARLQESEWVPVPRQIPWTPPVVAILTLAIPGALTFVLTGAEGAVINFVLASLPNSTDAIASWGVFERMLNLALMPAAGCAVAVVPFAGRLIPQGAIDRVRSDLLRTAIGVAVIGLVASALIGLAFPGAVARMFLEPTAGGRLPGGALEILRLLPFAVIAAVPFYLYRPLFEAAQRPRLGTALSATRFLALGVPFLLVGWLLSDTLGWDGLNTIPAALIAASACASVLAIFRAVRLLRETAAAARPTA